jgi:NAD(P)-dependent dehydrogenase (short-subunit alcohol dehydrogenase family)
MKPIRDQFIMVTGATDGIGKITASRLAHMGATILLHGRNEEKCRAVSEKIRQDSDNPKVECFVTDFSSLADVRQMGLTVREKYNHLDVLINNAGVLPVESQGTERPLSAQGYDLCLAVNYLAPFLLTHLLLPALRTSRAARIVNVASTAQEAIDFDDLMLTKNYGPMRAYSCSKLALVMFTFELDERLRGENITVNCMHPGSLLDTKMVRRAFSQPRGSAESGAEVEVYLATDPGLDGVSGVYFNQKNRSQAHPQAYDHALREKLWQLSLELTDLVTHLNG